MSKEKIKKIIKEVIEGESLLEMDYSPDEPLAHQHFKINDKEEQFAFRTKNGFDYYLSIMKTCLYLNDKEVINFCVDNKVEDKSKNLCYKFVVINFFASEDNPNSKEAFERKTGRDELILMMKNMIYLLNHYIDNNPNEKWIAFSAEPKRLSIYKDVIEKNYSNKFNIFPSKKYDKSYENDMILMIKK